MPKAKYLPVAQEDDSDGLLGDILNETKGSFQFDPASYFDDWLDEPTSSSQQNVEEKHQPAVQDQNKLIDLSSEEETEKVSSGRKKAAPKQKVFRKPPSREHTDSDGSEIPSPSTVPYGDESLGHRDPHYRHNTVPYEEEDELSYDHYDLVQAGLKPPTFTADRFDSQDDLDSGVILDVDEQSPFLGRSHNGRDKSMSKSSFDIAMSDEETAKKARWCLLCLKTYCIIFMITVISLSIYVAADFSTAAAVSPREEPDTSTGYKELRLGGRRVFYRTSQCEGMANHTVLLVHGETQTADLFNKLGTMTFLKGHGARAVAIDVIGYGRSDPPIHLPDSYEDFFTEVVSLFELEYNLILVCVELGCEKLLPYYLNHGVYREQNSFIEGAVFISPRGTTYSKYVQPSKAHSHTATRTLVVNGGKDSYINMEVTQQLSLVPRCEIHPLPNMKNGFYTNKNTKSYFHAALQAFIEGLQYEYDRELEELTEHQEGTGGGQNYPNNFNNQYNGAGYGQQNQQQQQGGGDSFSRFQAKQQKSSSGFKDLGYNPASRFSSIKGKRKK